MALESVRRGAKFEVFRETEGPPNKFRMVCFAKERYALDPSSREWKTWTRDDTASRTRILAGGCGFEISKTRMPGIDFFQGSDADNQCMRVSVFVDQFARGDWQQLTFGVVPAFVTGRENDDGDAEWTWRYVIAQGALDLTYETNRGVNKWSYSWTPLTGGRYRIRLVTTLLWDEEGTAAQIYNRRDGSPYQVSWTFEGTRRTFNYHFADAVNAGQLDSVTLNGLGMEIAFNGQTLQALETMTIDPTSTLTADWTADIETGSKFPNDGSDWCGDNLIDGNVRVGQVYDISGVPDGATIDNVATRQTKVGGTNANVYIGPYNGDGITGDPQTDSASTAFSRCAISGDNYGTFTEWSVGNVTDTVDLGTDPAHQANVDVAAALSGDVFSLAIQRTNESGSHTDFAEYTASSSTEPQLIIDYTDFTWEQLAFRYYDDDDTEDASTALEAENTDISRAKETPTQLRIASQASGDPPAVTRTLQVNKNGDAASEWRTVPTS